MTKRHPPRSAKILKKAKRARRHRGHLVLGLALAVGAFVVFGVGVFLATIDLNASRPRLAASLSEMLGRDLRLDGPLSWKLSWDKGLSLGAEKLVLANAPWGSRPEMGQIGKAELRLDLSSLVTRKLTISAFDLSDVDLLLETNKEGRGNWVMGASAPQEKKEVAKASHNKDGLITLKCERVTVRQSRLGWKEADGSITVIEMPELTYTQKGDEINLHYKGTVRGIPVEADIAAEDAEKLFSAAPWRFTGMLTYGEASLSLRGKMDLGEKKLLIEPYALSGPGTQAGGKVEVDFAPMRPLITGSLAGQRLTLADLTPEPETLPSADAAPLKEEQPRPVSSKGPLFSRTPLPLSALRTFDFHLDVDLDDASLGPMPIKDLKTRLDLTDGKLVLSPLKMLLAGGQTQGHLRLDVAENTTRLEAVLRAKQLSLSEFLPLGGFMSFMVGKGDADLNITSSGGSPHELAKNAKGVLDVVASGGSLSTESLGEAATGLLTILTPGAGALLSSRMNCMAGHFDLGEGQMKANGVLIDSELATFWGVGTADLDNERIAMRLYARAKAVDDGSALPPMKITGTLTNPSFGLDGELSVERVTGALLGNNGAKKSPVPVMLSSRGELNACAATLTAARTGKGGGIEEASMQGEGTIKDIGKKLLNSFGAGLLGGM